MAETVELELYFVAETEMAYGVTEDDPEDPVVWLAKSQVVDTNARSTDLGKVRSFEIPDWLAEDKGLV